MKKLLVLHLIFMFIFAPVCFAKNKVNFNTNIQNNFASKNFSQSTEFKTDKEVNVGKFIIPQNSLVKVDVMQAQKERRWHKSGFFVCKLNGYIEPDNKEINVSDEEIYFIVRRYEKIDKKEATILATEIILTQAAAVFAPGVDILYFFTKGAIKREKHPNWFKAGVHNAWDNSIFWFQQKGKNIELASGDEVNIKALTKEKAYNLKYQITKRVMKSDFKEDKKQLKKDLNEINKLEKEENKLVKLDIKNLKEEFKHDKKQLKKDLKEIVFLEKQENKLKKHEEKLARKNEKNINAEMIVSAKVNDSEQTPLDILVNETNSKEKILTNEEKLEYLNAYLEESGKTQEEFLTIQF